ncbi:MAG: hypothetical protein EOP83_04685 [Verrucomicrobiaceae bacterium]|nr:MAG: hypothetical protein EOP83_04685 [Verrucomicrobiaceae bacterium]
MEEPKTTQTFLQRWKEDPAQIVAGAFTMGLFLAGALTFLFGMAWAIKFEAGLDQIKYSVFFGLSVFAATIFPLCVLQNNILNGQIREANETAAKKAEKERVDAQRVAQRDAATLRVLRLRLLQWAVDHGQVDKIEGLAENLLADLKAHREEVRAQRRPSSSVIVTPLGTVR